MLYDDDCPITVANFLNYVADGDYDDSFFHRLVEGFVLQGGGFTYDSGLDQFDFVPADAPIVNEFLYSNVAGTIAMAKVGDDPDSATCQWFFNLADNSANLDLQNGGFTAFGEIIAGMDVMEALAMMGTNPANVDIWDASGVYSAWGELPLIDHDNALDYWPDNLEMVHSVSVIGTVPEPATMGLLGAGAIALIRRRRRR
jgi:peptidyl-prolyl cis-trans isomerase A (cyclophilin A)